MPQRLRCAAVRRENWIAIRPKFHGPLELYDLKIDVGETTDVAANQPEVVARIEAYLKDAHTESREWPLQAPPVKLVPK